MDVFFIPKSEMANRQPQTIVALIAEQVVSHLVGGLTNMECIELFVHVVERNGEGVMRFMVDQHLNFLQDGQPHGYGYTVHFAVTWRNHVVPLEATFTYDEVHGLCKGGRYTLREGDRGYMVSWKGKPKE